MNPGARIPEAEVEEQVISMRKAVDYDIKEFTIELLIQKYHDGQDTDENEIFLPAYQRAFVWDQDRRSKFIESVLLGLPIPYLFTAENVDGRLEIIDGSQRIRTLESFILDELVLNNLEMLDKCNGLRFSDFPISRQKKIKNTSLRMITLSEKSDEDARFMLFERINSGSMLLKDMEARKGSFPGPFTDFVYECSENETFKRLTAFTEKTIQRGEPQELILRYFAFLNRLKEYTGSINKFLDTFTKEMNDSFVKNDFLKDFDNMLSYVEAHFPFGFKKGASHTSTPRVRFEAIAIGVGLALRSGAKTAPNVSEWLDTEEFNKYVTGSSTNTATKTNDRIDFVRRKLSDI